MKEEVQNFIEWKNQVHDLYSSIVFYVLPKHPLSLHFTHHSTINEESIIHGIIMGFSDSDTIKSNIALFNISLPNESDNIQMESISNSKWGSVNQISEISLDNQLTSIEVLPNDNILAATTSNINYITSEDNFSFSYEDSPVLMIKSCHISDSEEVGPTSFLFHDNGNISHLNEQGIFSHYQTFSRPTLDASIDPFSPNIITTTQGKRTLRILDFRQQ